MSCYQLIYKAQAIQIARLKNITAKHLGPQSASA